MKLGNLFKTYNSLWNFNKRYLEIKTNIINAKLTKLVLLILYAILVLLLLKKRLNNLDPFMFEVVFLTFCYYTIYHLITFLLNYFFYKRKIRIDYLSNKILGEQVKTKILFEEKYYADGMEGADINYRASLLLKSSVVLIDNNINLHDVLTIISELKKKSMNFNIEISFVGTETFKILPAVPSVP